MNFTPGEWTVEALKTIESSRHLRVMGYLLSGAVFIYALAALATAIF